MQASLLLLLLFLLPLLGLRHGLLNLGGENRQGLMACCCCRVVHNIKDVNGSNAATGDIDPTQEIFNYSQRFLT